MPTLRSLARRVPILRDVARRLRGRPDEGPQRTVPASGPAAPGVDGLTELHRVTARPASGGTGPRLNLLLPNLEPARMYGGVRTALDLFEAMATSFPRRRIVAFRPPGDAASAALPGLVAADPADDAADAGGPALVVAAPNGATLAVGPDDVVLATFWTTAELAIRLARWQAAAFDRPVRPYAWLVQDFEPGFAPWSAAWALSRSLYDADVPTIGVVNSSPLAAFLDREGVRFAERFVFEPRISRALRERLAEPPLVRQRRIVVYGRPETPRNAFPLVVDGLRAWLAASPHPDWEIVSAGQPHPPVDLGGGRRLTSLGKLDLVAYGRLLRDSAVGVALMISPHPSYPPLEMAHLGLRTITNRFGPKDLEAWHENLRSLSAPTPEALAAALAVETGAFEADPTAGDRAAPRRPDFLADGPTFPFAATLAERLMAGS